MTSPPGKDKHKSQKDVFMPFFTWRTAILKSDLPPTTRHVLLTLSCHMNEAGESCFPSFNTLAEETGLSRPAVIKHVKTAIALGWLYKTQAKHLNDSWRSNIYEARIPKTLATPPVDEAPEEEGGSKRGLPPLVNEEYQGSKPGLLPLVNDVNTSTSVFNSTGNNHTPPNAGANEDGQKTLPDIPEKISDLVNFFTRKGFDRERVLTAKLTPVFIAWVNRRIPFALIEQACEIAEAKNSHIGTPAYYVSFVEQLEREMARPRANPKETGAVTRNSSAAGGNRHGKFAERDYQAGATPIEDLDWFQDESV